MGRRRSMRDKFKQQMKSYRKKKMKKAQESTPYLPPDGEVYVMNSLNPTKKMKAEVVKTKTKRHREIITQLACPKCGEPMDWDKNWEGFICTKHGKKAIYEIVEKD
ncbi:MAG: hypothetical protein V5A64_06050 [Candidatus Thermoplasmatota archaeon]